MHGLLSEGQRSEEGVVGTGQATGREGLQQEEVLAAPSTLGMLDGQQLQGSSIYVQPPSGTPRGSPLLRWMRRRPSKRNDNSWVVCVAVVLLLVADLSLLSLVLPLFTFGFSLVSQYTPRLYWQAALVYAEVLLIAQYSYLCLVRCLCEASSAAEHGELSPGAWDQVSERPFFCDAWGQVSERPFFCSAWDQVSERPLFCNAWDQVSERPSFCNAWDQVGEHPYLFVWVAFQG
uniref:Piezo transmembrane helical unit domain-containing protein n=1 Tax=Dunaliella tertiolecta TaxID=3047 RepID=A0A7S3VT45_DUNTE